MLERDRLESKKISKTQSVTSQLSHDLGERNVHIGPSDYIAWLDDRKWAFVRLEGRAFGDVPLSLEYKLEVWDSPNSAGVIIDAVRAAKIAMEVLGQDASRADIAKDNNSGTPEKHAALPFLAGDVIFVGVNFTGFKSNIGSQTYSASVTGGAAGGAAQQLTAVAMDARLTAQQYYLKITLA
jgi:hypothetical protein